jgi:hypothetical protein
MQDERTIELIAKSLDEPLTPSEQEKVNLALQNSVALRITADGLHEFDALLKRTHMAIPSDGFPLRVLARLEAYEHHRRRIEWLLTLGILFLGSLAASLWVIFNFDMLVETIAQLLTTLLAVVPILFNALFILTNAIGNGPLLLYALIVLALTWIWGRASGGWAQARIRR